MAAAVLCKNFVNISYENSHTHTSELYLAAAYLYLKCNFILVCGMPFLIYGTLTLATLEHDGIYSVSITAYISHYAKLTALH